MSSLTHDPDRHVPAGVRRPPAPGEEVAGPAISELVVELAASRRALEALYLQARVEARARIQSGVATAQTDANGDALLELFSVPGSATGHLLRAVLDEAGVTPAAPDTNADLWHAIYSSGSAGAARAAGVVAVGAMLDFRLGNLAAPGQAMIPDSYAYGENDGPSLVGPATFYVVVDGATPGRQIACRWSVLVHQPEP